MTELSGEIPRGRVVSIDALRGFDMFWIIGGGAIFVRLFDYFDNPVTRVLKEQLEHAYWHGFHFEDLIFPLFLFIMGASMPFSISKRLERGDSRNGLYRHILKRTLIIYFLGLVYYGFFELDFANQRYVGVLPRIAMCYFLASMIVMNSGIRGQAIWTAAILLLYWAAMYLVPVPGYGAGNITPEGNLSAWVDMNILPGRLNHYGAYMYGDTTGLLGIVPSTASTLLGTLAGHWLRTGRPMTEKVKWLVIAGVACLATGLVWNFGFPINKHIWSSSFVVFAGGWCFLLLALFYWIIDVRGWQKWAFPFVVIGLNPITIYFSDRIIDFSHTSDFILSGIGRLSGDFKPVIFALGALTLKWLFLYFLYKRKIFLKA